MFIKNHDDSSHFISLSDIMTALMLVFLFVSVAIITQIQQQNENVQRITSTYQTQKAELYTDLEAEFKHDKGRWGAKIEEKTLSISFEVDHVVMFDTGQSEIRSEFKETLAEFFPRYLALIKRHIDVIQEIRIEGHTDTRGKPGQTEQESYFYNMKLSQDRTRSVLEYCLTLPEFTKSDFDMMKQHITANGLSFSHAKQDGRGRENRQASRRVEFRILTKAEDKLETIIKEIQ